MTTISKNERMRGIWSKQVFLQCKFIHLYVKPFGQQTIQIILSTNSPGLQQHVWITALRAAEVTSTDSRVLQCISEVLGLEDSHKAKPFFFQGIYILFICPMRFSSLSVLGFSSSFLTCVSVLLTDLPRYSLQCRWLYKLYKLWNFPGELMLLVPSKKKKKKAILLSD